MKTGLHSSAWVLQLNLRKQKVATAAAIAAQPTQPIAIPAAQLHLIAAMHAAAHATPVAAQAVMIQPAAAAQALANGLYGSKVA